MGIVFQKVACSLLVVYIGKAVPVYVHGRKKAYTTLEHAAVEKKATGNCWEADRTAVCRTFYKFEIKIISSFMSNLALFKTSSLYAISPLYRAE